MIHFPYRLLAAALLLLPVSGALADETPQQDAEAKFVHAKCSASLARMNKFWGVKGEWQQVASEDPSVVIYQSPTRTVGVWVNARFHADGRVDLARTAPESTSYLSWDRACALTAETREHPLDEREMKSAFTDESLVQLMKKHKYGVIYVWSPHMTYSMAGVNEIEKVTREMNVPLEIVRDPNTGGRSIASAAKHWNIPAGSFKRLESMELMNRGALNHFPVMAVYANGEVRTVIPGLKTPGEYAENIHAEIDR